MTVMPLNPVLELMHAHGTVRRYRPEPVSQETVTAIVAAAQRASTSSNLQLWTVVAVTDEAKRKRLAELCGNQRHVAEAPVFLAWCADLARLDRVCELRGYTQVAEYTENFLVAAVDAAIAAQNAAVAAESLGLGICYIGAIRNNPADVIALLDLPQRTFPVTGMTLGWPAAHPPIRPRLDTEAVLHWERYDTTEQDRLLAAYDEAMIATGIYQGRQVPIPGGSGEMENYGWLEHSARRVSQPARTELRQVLEAQGFLLE
jgi:FMN reductase (NADPH)